VNVSSEDDNNISMFIDFDNTLIAWWRMDDVDDSGNVTDYLNRHNGTPYGDAVQTGGILGRAFDFDGVDSYINTTFDPIISEGESFSFSLWSKTLAIAVDRNVIFGAVAEVKGGAPSRSFFSFDIESQHCDDWSFRLQFRDEDNPTGVTDIMCSNNVYDDLQWHNAVVIFDSDKDNITLYVDGIVDVYMNMTNVSNGTKDFIGTPLLIGSRNILGVPSYFYDGEIDDVIYFNRTLTEEEVIGLYANQTSKYLTVNFTNLANGTHTFKAYSQDTAGNVNETELRTVTTKDSCWTISLLGLVTIPLACPNTNGLIDRSSILADVNKWLE